MEKDTFRAILSFVLAFTLIIGILPARAAAEDKGSRTLMIRFLSERIDPQTGLSRVLLCPGEHTLKVRLMKPLTQSCRLRS